jgi:hypothetical protein
MLYPAVKKTKETNAPKIIIYCFGKTNKQNLDPELSSSCSQLILSISTRICKCEDRGA